MFNLLIFGWARKVGDETQWSKVLTRHNPKKSPKMNLNGQAFLLGLVFLFAFYSTESNLFYMVTFSVSRVARVQEGNLKYVCLKSATLRRCGSRSRVG